MTNLEQWGISFMSAKIVSTGSYIPSKKISNFDFEKIMDTSDAWIKQRTGIESRYFEDDSTSHMALEASKKALENIDVESIDCILVGTYTPDNLIPTVASTIRMKLGIKKSIPAFDINAACSGFIFTLHTARAFIQSKIYKRILVVGVDFNSRILDFNDRSTSILFGDGAGAVVLEASQGTLFDSIIHSQSDINAVLSLPNASDFKNPFIKREIEQNPYFKMDGSTVFKFAVGSMVKGIQEILKENKLEIDEIDYIISHQANARIIETGAKLLKLDVDKFLMNVDRVGNTSSGSVPLLLDEVNRLGKLKTGMNIIMVAFGGGLSYGTSLIEWS